MTINYNLKWPTDTTQLTIELSCYRHNHKPENGGLGKFQHLKNAYALLYPHLIPSYNTWTEAMLFAFQENDKVGGGTTSILGGSGTSKSFTAGHWAVLDWLASPSDTITILTSTTLQDLGERVWKYAKQAYNALPNKPGKLRISRPESIQYGEGKLLTAALDEDPEGESIKGFHPKRLRIIVDEATAISPSIMNLWSNWTASQKEFTLISLSNFRGLDNLCAHLTEPIQGWNSVDYDAVMTWKTRLGSAVLLDLTKSPVYKNPELGKPGAPLAYIRSKQSVDEAINKLGPNHPRVLQYIRSIPAFDDSAKTVVSMKQIERCRVFRKPHWAGFGQTKLVALDPAFTSDGDEAILAPGTLGYESGASSKRILDIGNLISIPVDSKSRTPVEYQLLEYTVKYCEENGIEPENFIMDATGSGRGIASVFEKEWSRNINTVDAVTKASDRIVDFENNRTAHDLYDRKVTELWFVFRDFIDSMQITGLDRAAALQFCSRLYEQKGTGKIKIEPKPLYKRRMYGLDATTGSPDQADASVYLLELAIRHGLELSHEKGLHEDRVVTSYESKAQEVVKKWMESRERASQEPAGEVADDFTWNGSWSGIDG